MSMVAKILIVLNLFLAVAFMGAAGAYVNSSENYMKKFKAEESAKQALKSDMESQVKKLQDSLDEARKAQTAAENAKNAAEATAKTLLTGNEMLQRKLDKMSGDLTTLAAKIGDLQKNLDNARADIGRLSGEKDKAMADRREALDKQNAAETEAKRLSAELAACMAAGDSLRVAQADLAESLEKTTTELNMYKSVYPPVATRSVSVKGVVLAADSKMDIYLISVGGKAGLQLNDELTVFRGGHFVASVVVDRVMDDKCAVYVKRLGGTPLKKDDIRQGDEVTGAL